VDWAYFATVEEDGRRKKPYAFLMTLGYSRATYVEFTDDLSTPTLIACHLTAFKYLGGHPKAVLYDNNMKNVILWRAVGVDRNQFNPWFLDFAAYYGMTVRLSAVY
jgi:transposase